MQGPPADVCCHLGSVAETDFVLDALLTRNILPFWFPGTIDRHLGGYQLDHDLAGSPKASTRRRLVAQARMLWFYSALVNAGRGSEAYLAAARHGYEFLHKDMWDSAHGGFFWETDAADDGRIKSGKHSYAQAFALYALSEYALASQDQGTQELARTLFQLLMEKAKDPEHPGFFEMLDRTWQPVSDWTYMPHPPDCKTMDTHLHLLEAIECYYRMSSDPRAAEPLAELCRINSRTVMRDGIAVSAHRFRRDWTPVAGRRNERVFYGHDLENIWLLAESAPSLGHAVKLDAGLFRPIFDAALRHGYDSAAGGFFLEGAVGKAAQNRHKIWWVQAEALVAALWMYNLTEEQSYADCYLGTLRWIVHHQADWERGDWHAAIAPNGRPLGDKAGPWKTAYHNGRAMLWCLELLKRATAS